MEWRAEEAQVGVALRRHVQLDGLVDQQVRAQPHALLEARPELQLHVRREDQLALRQLGELEPAARRGDGGVARTQ